jgi:hypothetical protein
LQARCDKDDNARHALTALLTRAGMGRPDLSPQGRQRQKRRIASQTLGDFQNAKDLPHTREVIERQMAKWSEKVGLAIKPAANIHEATIHAQIRDRLASTKNGRDRMALLEKYGDDPSPVLTAPQFLSGLRDAELAMVKHKVEEHMPR